jgi:hypothetical protein
MTRYMYDDIGEGAATLEQFHPEMLAIYLTGGPVIEWTNADVALFPETKTWVRIDQGGARAPQYEANVVDCEAGDYTLNEAIAWLGKCTAPRPTLYTTRSTLPGYHGTRDVWLAAPGLSDAQAIALAATDRRIVAVQNVWHTASPSWDRSIVIDPYWPEKKPVTPPVVNHEKAPAPPGEWKDVAVLIGEGLDGHVWQTTYNVATGKWSTPVKVG